MALPRLPTLLAAVEHPVDHVEQTVKPPIDRPSCQYVGNVLGVLPVRTRSLAVVLASAGAAVLLTAVGALGASIGGDRTGSVTVAVTLKNSGVTLSAKAVPAGAVVFRVANKATLRRTFAVATKKVSLAPGGAAVMRLTLAKAGKLVYVSTAPGHPQATVRGTITVTAVVTGPTTNVAVSATEFKFDLSQQSVPVGTVIFTITNNGQIPHDFSIMGKTSDLIGSGQSTTLTVTFTKPGAYPYLCQVPGHAEEGMKGVLTVT